MPCIRICTTAPAAETFQELSSGQASGQVATPSPPCAHVSEGLTAHPLPQRPPKCPCCGHSPSIPTTVPTWHNFLQTEGGLRATCGNCTEVMRILNEESSVTLFLP